VRGRYIKCARYSKDVTLAYISYAVQNTVIKAFACPKITRVYRSECWFVRKASKIYLSRLRIPRLECVGFGEWLGAKAQD